MTSMVAGAADEDTEGVRELLFAGNAAIALKLSARGQNVPSPQPQLRGAKDVMERGPSPSTLWKG